MSDKSEKTILYIAPSSSTHTKKWCREFIRRGYRIHVASFEGNDIPGVTVHHLRGSSISDKGDLGKLSYLMSASKLSHLIDRLDPDIVHAHYASSYGAITALACKRPYFLSVWGADVYDFPRKSVLHRAFLKFCLKRPTWIMSTSKAMANETNRYTDKKILVTPFGVDMTAFSPEVCTEERTDFAVGTVKALESKYGIEYLLHGCAIALKIDPAIPLRVRIAGSGSEERRLKQLCDDLGLGGRTEWLGFVDPADVPSVWRSLDMAIVPSQLESESFGVSAVEAQACGIPVIISEIPGLMEATLPGESSIVVPLHDSESIGKAIVHLYKDTSLRRRMGTAAREFVAGRFELNTCFDVVERAYAEELKKK